MTKPIIALLYDFDKTLCTTDMEDYAFIPALGYTPAEFWHKANTFGRENRMDGLLAYMYTMIAECRAQGKDLKRDFLVACGRSMELFPGVREWFQRINAFGEQQGVTIEHYVLSSGLKEIIEGSGIAHEFKQIYACEFYYDEAGAACWPKLDVNFTNKTQFVYRINKGVLDVADDKTLNDSMPDDSKRIPFTNMIYVGDGLSDVPCMKMMRAYGGQAIAVYQATNRAGVEDLLAKGRVQVNGTVCKKGDTQLKESDTVAVDGKALAYQKFVYLMLNKPEGVVSASTDKRDTTVVDLVGDAYPRRELFPAGRLDKTSTGFVLLTDDGTFAHEILAPKRHVSKTYTVVLDTPLTEEMRTGFAAGVTLADGTALSPAEVTALSADGLTVRVVLRQGVYHQIKRMFGVYGAGVNGLHRDAIGGLALDAALAPGQWRELSAEEVSKITI